jgi:hypothetical protein
MNKIDRQRLRAELDRHPADLRALCEALLSRSDGTLPADYDAVAAFADILTLARLSSTPSAARPPIARLARWLFERLPPVASGGGR